MNVLTRLLMWAFILAWAAFAAQGVIAYLSLEPEDSGFTRGLNRVAAFFRWQALALAAAVAASVFARISNASGVSRRVAKAPLWISGGFFILTILGFVALVIYARLLN